jgi:hypothetical protein
MKWFYFVIQKIVSMTLGNIDELLGNFRDICIRRKPDPEILRIVEN